MDKDNGIPPGDGILVVDLTRLLPGPFCTLQLADLGARVQRALGTSGWKIQGTRRRPEAGGSVLMHAADYTRRDDLDFIAASALAWEKHLQRRNG